MIASIDRCYTKCKSQCGEITSLGEARALPVLFFFSIFNLCCCFVTRQIFKAHFWLHLHLKGFGSRLSEIDNSVWRCLLPVWHNYIKHNFSVAKSSFTVFEYSFECRKYKNGNQRCLLTTVFNAGGLSVKCCWVSFSIDDIDRLRI